jgi:hypothetical protein
MMCSPPEGFEEKDGPDWVNRIKAFMAQSDGAYAMVMMNRNQIYGFRDEHGLRPLCIGKIPIPGTDKVILPTILHLLQKNTNSTLRRCVGNYKPLIQCLGRLRPRIRVLCSDNYRCPAHARC